MYDVHLHHHTPHAHYHGRSFNGRYNPPSNPVHGIAKDLLKRANRAIGTLMVRRGDIHTERVREERAERQREIRERQQRVRREREKERERYGNVNECMTTIRYTPLASPSPPRQTPTFVPHSPPPSSPFVNCLHPDPYRQRDLEQEWGTALSNVNTCNLCGCGALEYVGDWREREGEIEREIR